MIRNLEGDSPFISMKWRSCGNGTTIFALYSPTKACETSLDKTGFWDVFLLYNTQLLRTAVPIRGGPLHCPPLRKISLGSTPPMTVICLQAQHFLRHLYIFQKYAYNLFLCRINTTNCLRWAGSFPRYPIILSSIEITYDGLKCFLNVYWKWSITGCILNNLLFKGKSWSTACVLLAKCINFSSSINLARVNFS